MNSQFQVRVNLFQGNTTITKANMENIQWQIM
jgi:hypothetical protein